jgi:hypothetical protein
MPNKALLIVGALDDKTCALEDHFFPHYRTLQGAKHPRLQAHVLTTGHDLDEPTALSMRQVTADWIVRSFPGGVVKAADGKPSEPSAPQPRQ